MNNYETIFIVRPNLEQEAITAAIEKIKGVITNNGGEIVEVEDWGKKKLAYPIAKQTEGYYTLINFKSDADLPKELTRVYKITDSIIRNIIVSRD